MPAIDQVEERVGGGGLVVALLHLAEPDFALEPMTKEESKDLYQLFLERTGRASMIKTSNRDIAQWLAVTPPMIWSSKASRIGLGSSQPSMPLTRRPYKPR